MDAETEYYTICANRYLHPLKAGEYGEVHHILPRSLGGMDISQNLVKLTPEEHYRVHELLPFIYTEGKAHAKMVFAWNQMCGRVKGVEVDAETYGQLKREYSKVNSESHKGRKYSAETKSKLSEIRKGHVVSEETKQRISQALKGKKRGRISEETRLKRSAALKGKPAWNKGLPAWNRGKSRSDETKRKISDANKGKTAWNKGRHLSEEARRKKSEAMKHYWVQHKGNLGVA